MVRRGTLKAPTIGIGRSAVTIDQLRERARASVTEYGGGVDKVAFPKLLEQLHYINGDYRDPGTFVHLREALNGATRPTYYRTGQLPRFDLGYLGSAQTATPLPCSPVQRRYPSGDV